MNLEWLKKHKYAAAAGILVVLVILYLLLKRGGQSSGGGLAGAISAQNQGQLQMAQLNAQLSAQSEQTQAQLAAQEFQTESQTQAQRDALAAQLAGQILPIQAETPIYEQELKQQFAQQQALIPLEITAQKQIGRGGSLETAGAEELALLLGQTEAVNPLAAGNAAIQVAKAQNNPTNTFLTGLFGTLSNVIP